MGTSCELEARMRDTTVSIGGSPSGMSPRDEQGGIVRWYGTGVDIENASRPSNGRTQEPVLRKKSIKPRCSRRSSGPQGPYERCCLTSPRCADGFTYSSRVRRARGRSSSHAIHKRSQRSARVFVSVNCGAIPPTSLPRAVRHEKVLSLVPFSGESSLRTGGRRNHLPGEIGELPAETQLACCASQERQFDGLAAAGRWTSTSG